jgi:hypothetical protein
VENIFDQSLNYNFTNNFSSGQIKGKMASPPKARAATAVNSDGMGKPILRTI